MSRRRLLQGVGAAAVLAQAPAVVRGTRGLLAQAADADAGTGYSLGIASFDPTPDSVLLWAKPDECIHPVRWRVALAEHPDDHPTSLAGMQIVADGLAEDNGDNTVLADVTDLDPGRHYWYQFETALGAVSSIGRTRTAPLDASAGVRLALASCHDWQQGWYTLWRDIAEHDLDAVLFVGDYIYEYESYLPTDTRTWPRIHTDGDGNPVGETYTLEDYRSRYRLYRSDPDLRLAHRRHPFIVVWDDHEVAGDRWDTGAVNHGDNEDPNDPPWDVREAAGITAYFEYLPARGAGPRFTKREGIQRTLSYGDLADLILLDARTFRSEGVGGTNRNFNPLSNIDEPGISDPDRTLLGHDQKAWFKQALRAAGGKWKLVGNPLMITPLNLASMPDLLGGVVADISQTPPFDNLPVTWHDDGVPVNTDQWDGYQPERREIMGFLRGDEGGGRVDDTVFLSGDIHTAWSSEAHVEQGDAPVGTPVAVEFVCPGISSENFNERIGMIAFGTPMPNGATNTISPGAMVLNRHVRHVDFDSNGWVLVDVTDERVQATHRILVNPTGTDPSVNPIENRNAQAADAVGGAWQVARGDTRLTPVIV
ncbi:MAG: alkaline phosphatase D family protein [Nitriliruptorales bacterium]|nr:alkaline phosphatase D family protein [Nitriliruptorales bacterium]